MAKCTNSMQYLHGACYSPQALSWEEPSYGARGVRLACLGASLSPTGCDSECSFAKASCHNELDSSASSFATYQPTVGCSWARYVNLHMHK